MDTDYAIRLADTVMRRFPRAGRYPYKDWSYPQGYFLSACFDETRRPPCVWSEGLSWYALILSEVLDMVPEGHPAYATAQRQLLELLAGLLKVQDAGGLWYQVVDCPDRPDNWCDVSGSAMFTYAFCHALRLGLVQGEAYEKAAAKGWAGVKSRITENAEGLLDVYGACEGLCVQKRYEDYVHYPQKRNGQEAVCGCLWAAAAI